MKAHLTERTVKGLQPKAKNIIVYDEEVIGFGVRITSGGTRAFILTYRIEARERRLAAEDEARPVDQRGLSPTTAPVRRSDWLGRRDKWF